MQFWLLGQSLSPLFLSYFLFQPRVTSMQVVAHLRRGAAAYLSYSRRRSILFSSSYSSSIPMMSSQLSGSEQDFSLRALEDYAAKIVQVNKEKNEEDSTSSSVCLAIAGGGSNAISTLAATPGASSILLEGTLAYDRSSIRSYLGMSLQDVDAQTDFKYTSRKAAKLASEVALQRAMKFRSGNLQKMSGCIGVGCSSSLVSPPSPDSGIGHIVATRADGLQIAIDISLVGKTDSFARSRKEEDVFISHMIFQAIENVQNAGASTKLRMKESRKTDVGDSISQEWGNIINSESVVGGEEEDVGIIAANRVLQGEEPVVVLLPTYKNGETFSFRALAFPAIPDGSLVFPGSFNPPHVGHENLARASIQKANSLSHRHDKKAIFMELSLTNADKPPIDPETVSERLQKFLKLDNMPGQWGIVLTRAPLFAQKVSTLQANVMTSTDRDRRQESSSQQQPQISFVIGTDTLVRIIDPKYYGNSETSMMDAIRSMKGVQFYVGGRLEQKKGDDTTTAPRFVSGEEEIQGLPEDVRAKFIIIREDDFRVDLSSSEIRAGKKASS